jgi:hypothetical protein
MAKVIKFYIPIHFQKKVAWVPSENLFVWLGSFLIPITSYAQVNTVACASSAMSGRERCWCRKKPSRSSRVCIR